MSIQDTIYRLELGSGAVWLRRIAAVIGFLALTAWYVLTQFSGLASMEAMDYAQLARAVARGEGFQTQFIRPLALAELRDTAYRRSGQKVGPTTQVPAATIDLQQVPDTFNAPLYPYALSVAFKLAGHAERTSAADFQKSRILRAEYVMVGFNLLCFVLTAGLLYYLGVRLFDQRVGLLSVAIFLLADLQWQFVLSGLSTSLTMLLLLGAITALHEAWIAEEEGRTVALGGWALGGSALLGAAFLTSYSIAWIAPWYGVALAWPLRNRWWVVSLSVLVILAIVAPWLLRNWSLTGNPLGHVMNLVGLDGTSYAGTSLLRSYRLDQEALVWKDCVQKLFTGLSHFSVQGWGLVGGGLAAIFFVASWLHPFRQLRANLLRFFVIIAGLTLVMSGTLVQPRPEALSESNTLVLLVPVLLLFGVAFFFILLDRLELNLVWLKPCAVVLLIGLHTAPLLLTLAPPDPATYRYPPYFPPVLRYIGNLYTPTETLVSDLPWAVAWYGDRATIWLPATVKDFFELHDYVHACSGLLLTPQTGNAAFTSEINKGEWKEWSMLIKRQGIPPNFPLTAVMPSSPSFDEYLLLTDRTRWQ